MELLKKHCIPCEGGAKPLSSKQEDSYRKETLSWNILRKGVHKIRKQFVFDDFAEAMAFVNRIAAIAEHENHHPNIAINYNKVEIELFTHSIKGLSENDFILAAKIDAAVLAKRNLLRKIQRFFAHFL